FQLLITRPRSGRARDCHDPYRINDFALMSSNNFAQPPADAIAHYSAPNRARGDKPSAKMSRAFRRSDAKDDQLAAIDPAVRFYMFEFGGLNQPAALGKCEAFCRHTSSVNCSCRRLWRQI